MTVKNNDKEKREKLKLYHPKKHNNVVREDGSPDKNSLRFTALAFASLLNPLLPTVKPKKAVSGEAFYNCLGLKIARLRKSKGLLQRDLAKLSGISISYLSRIERGYAVQGVTLDILAHLAEALQIEMQNMFAFTPEEIAQAHYRSEIKKFNC
ncbi:helix-turn-helix domain-containing protein [uncultured Veillonella sp.]|uniref:helix-turn-helix domain-containing protein n=1 Tax=uncultured Veillonella sp. TaxID=159268 RepID=UPI00260E1BC2|nr:helix-turn-helix transcriptional regulator [uncultured Veillonella sp.]